MDNDNKKRPSVDITLITVLIIVFGLIEIIILMQYFYHNTSGTTFDPGYYLAASISVLYIISSVLLLKNKKKSFLKAIILLITNVVIRAIMGITHLFPTDTPLQIAGYIVGISFTLTFITYAVLKIRSIAE